jgi:hypothetical protein
MAQNTFGHLLTVRVLVRVAYVAISLSAIPYANGAEAVPAHGYGYAGTVGAAPCRAGPEIPILEPPAPPAP